MSVMCLRNEKGTFHNKKALQFILFKKMGGGTSSPFPLVPNPLISSTFSFVKAFNSVR